MAGAEEGGEYPSGLFVHPTLTVRPNQAFQVRSSVHLTLLSIEIVLKPSDTKTTVHRYACRPNTHINKMNKSKKGKKEKRKQ